MSLELNVKRFVMGVQMTHAGELKSQLFRNDAALILT